MKGTIFKQEVGSSHARLEDWILQKFSIFIGDKIRPLSWCNWTKVLWSGMVLRITWWHKGALFLNSGMAQVTPVAGAELFADKSSFNTVLGWDPNTCSLTPKEGLTGDCLMGKVRVWRNAFVAAEGEGIITNVLALCQGKDTDFLYG